MTTPITLPYASWQSDPQPDALGHVTIRPADGTPTGNTDVQPIATVYDPANALPIELAPDLIRVLGCIAESTSSYLAETHHAFGDDCHVCRDLATIEAILAHFPEHDDHQSANVRTDAPPFDASAFMHTTDVFYYEDPYGNPYVYITAAGVRLCSRCATAETTVWHRDTPAEWRLVDVRVNIRLGALHCDYCRNHIPCGPGVPQPLSQRPTLSPHPDRPLTVRREDSLTSPTQQLAPGLDTHVDRSIHNTPVNSSNQARDAGSPHAQSPDPRKQACAPRRWRTCLATLRDRVLTITSRILTPPVAVYDATADSLACPHCGAVLPLSEWTLVECANERFWSLHRDHDIKAISAHDGVFSYDPTATYDGNFTYYLVHNGRAPRRAGAPTVIRD